MGVVQKFRLSRFSLERHICSINLKDVLHNISFSSLRAAAMEPMEAVDGDGGAGPAGPGRAGPAPSQVPGALCQQYLGDVLGRNLENLWKFVKTQQWFEEMII